MQKRYFMIDKNSIKSYFETLQDNICQALEQADGKGVFREDVWQREGGGGGRTRIIENGSVIEKGGVNFSAVYGETHESLLKQLKIEEKTDFFACGVSIVLHPRNPLMPIIHKNIRYFEMTNGLYWFGGGIDLTPHYVDENDAKWFHQQLKNVCDKAHPDFHTKHKNWADDYFFIKHRNETRGIGGIFFDNLNEKSSDLNKQAIFDYVKSVGESFVPIYTYFIEKNANLPYNETEKQWQYLRRGRYTEFNLVWDRGTKFGLETNGRTESILMSLPPQANWVYDFQVEPNSKEAQTLAYLRKGIDWTK